MNERIQELMIEAFQSHYGDPVTPVSREKAVELVSGWGEKFAELIVRECAEIALEQKKWVEDMKVHNPHDEVWNKARIQQSQHIVDKIKEHFGVEE